MEDASSLSKLSNAEILGDFTLREAARLNQTHGLRLKFLPEPALRLAHEMLLLPSEELPSFARQVQIRLRAIGGERQQGDGLRLPGALIAAPPNAGTEYISS
jgi:hypothetical protein